MYNGDHTELIGKTVKSITIDNGDNLNIVVIDDNESEFRYGIRHFQDCCENVSLVKYDGDLDHSIGKKIVDTSSFTSDISSDGFSGTKTVFRVECEDDNYLWFEWHGFSNGYYGEGVTFFKYNDDGSYDRW